MSYFQFLTNFKGLETCGLEKDVGPCKALLERYFYNPKTNVCEEFSYGGCGGNKNNFESKEACQAECSNLI